MPGCKQGDLAVIVYSEILNAIEKMYIGTFLTCGKPSVVDNTHGFDIIKPSQPLLDENFNKFCWAADSCLQPIRPQPKVNETDKLNELEHML